MSRRILLVVAGGLAVVLSAVSLAWACVPAGNLVLSPNTGPAGSLVTATAGGFPEGDPIEIRWKSLSGPILASGTGPALTTQITIPADAPGGDHVVIAAVADPEHAADSAGRAVFKIPGGAPPPGPGSGNPPGRVIDDPFAPFGTTKGKTIKGTSGDDTIKGTPYADVIRCGAGNDVVDGGAGNDVIDCGAGKDRVKGGSGKDRVSGGSGKDNLFGGTGDDKLSGGPGGDKLSGGAGKDKLMGGAGDDTLRGNGGKDRLLGGGGRDVLFRGLGDILAGGAGTDRMIG